MYFVYIKTVLSLPSESCIQKSKMLVLIWQLLFYDTGEKISALKMKVMASIML